MRHRFGCFSGVSISCREALCVWSLTSHFESARSVQGPCLALGHSEEEHAARVQAQGLHCAYQLCGVTWEVMWENNALILQRNRAILKVSPV